MKIPVYATVIVSVLKNFRRRLCVHRSHLFWYNDFQFTEIILTPRDQTEVLVSRVSSKVSVHTIGVLVNNIFFRRKVSIWENQQRKSVVSRRRLVCGNMVWAVADLFDHHCKRRMSTALQHDYIFEKLQRVMYFKRAFLLISVRFGLSTYVLLSTKSLFSDRYYNIIHAHLFQ